MISLKLFTLPLKTTSKESFIKYFLITISIFGLLIRFSSTIITPLWLDEQYSIYFASNYSYLQLLFNSPDSHPGLYYAIVKIMMGLNANHLLIRFLFSQLPQLLGIFLLAKYYRNKLSPVKLQLLISALLINPFFIYYSWQIRMYSLVFLASCLYWIAIQQKISPIKLILINLFFNHFSYIFFIISTLITIPYAIFYYAKKSTKIIFFFTSLFLLILQFLLLAGINYKEKIQLATWIPSPTINNIPSVITTAMGGYFSFNNESNLSTIGNVLFYLLFSIIITYLLINYKKFNTLLSLVIFPLFLIIFISILLPFLSHRQFFYHFIPSVSLFIPRMLIPFSVFIVIYFFTQQKIVIAKYVSIVLLIIWTITIWQLKPFQLHPISEQTKIIQNLPSSALILPPWSILKKINSTSDSTPNSIINQFNTAQKIEKLIVDHQTNYQNYCQIINNYSSIYLDINELIFTAKNYQNNYFTILNQCCQQATNISTFQAWNCTYQSTLNTTTGTPNLIKSR